jgi:hypothetical protein
MLNSPSTTPLFIPNGLAVDVDDTLCETEATCRALMEEEFGLRKDGELADGVVSDAVLGEHLRPAQGRGAALDWQSTQAQLWLAQHLNTEDFLLELPLVPGAQTGLSSISKTIPISLYITSRTTAHQTVTAKWLQTHNFPVAPVITRDPSVRSPDWKLQFFTQHQLQLEAFIDNEAAAFASSFQPSINHPIWFNRSGKMTNPLFESFFQTLQPTILHSWEEITKYLQGR